ncbi:TRAP transporter substrate-binding protein DctP [Butyricicoccus sp.]|uniref:TRAP transporter substrate-binding protein DctP n=1 Tax=Butyricicoccus sp. TaxID=2049021 RepID=UPI003F151F94
MKFPTKLSLLITLPLLLCGCTGGNAEREDTMSVQYFRLASGQSENYVTNQACTQFCKLVEERTDGSVIIEPYFDNSLGTEDEMLEQCRFGGIDFVRVSAAGASKYAPQLTALQMPYEYLSDKHLFRVLDGDIGRTALDSLDAADLDGLTYFYAGFRCFFSTEQVLDSLDKMDGLCLRVSSSSFMPDLVRQWGAQAVSLSGSDLAAALRSGQVDGAEDNLPTYVDSGYYRLAPYWVYDRHTYNADLLIASKSSMEQLTDEQRNVIADCAAEAAQWQREHWINAEVRAMMHASRSGCYMALMDSDEAERFRAAAQPLYETLTEEQKNIVLAISELADSGEQ